MQKNLKINRASFMLKLDIWTDILLHSPLIEWCSLALACQLI